MGKGGGKGNWKGGNYCIEENIVENMYPWFCIRTLDTSHGHDVKNYEKRGRGEPKKGEKGGNFRSPFFITN